MNNYETHEDESWVHVNDLPDYSYLEVLLKNINRALYSTGDVDALEDAVDELNGIFHIKTPAGKPLLEMSQILWAAQRLDRVKLIKKVA